MFRKFSVATILHQLLQWLFTFFWRFRTRFSNQTYAQLHQIFLGKLQDRVNLRDFHSKVFIHFRLMYCTVFFLWIHCLQKFLTDTCFYPCCSIRNNWKLEIISSLILSCLGAKGKSFFKFWRISGYSESTSRIKQKEESFEVIKI